LNFFNLITHLKSLEGVFMITFLTTVHILACIGLIILVLMQDSKGGGMFSGQSSSNSVLGATGGATLTNNLTKVVSVILAVTCLSLAVMMAKSQKSVVDTGVMAGANQPAAQTTAPVAAMAASVDATKTVPAATVPAEPKK
jgi:preprotein translocase subunit SecG